ncbi:MFS transporter [Kallotenue papyrolyticum]|uniref:MFS transporter n=1 Tax=Kallotenue papyrolyticum TaxID=1325125 RepID=UPI0004785E8C|nr:MFS transporter [Kallotenue papyrolyticum]
MATQTENETDHLHNTFATSNRTPPRRRVPFSHGFRALRVRNYRLYWSGQLISMTGSWMQTTAQAWLVLQLAPESPLALSLVTVLQFLPVLLLSLFGGAIADLFPKRRLLLVTQSIAMARAFVFGLLVASGLIQIWQVYLLALLQGLINAVDNPTRQAFAVELVGRETVVNAVALNSVTFNLARVLGPALAGVMIAHLGVAPVLFINAISFLAVIIGLLLMNPAQFFAAPRETEGRLLARVWEGLSYAWRTPQVLAVLLIVAIIGTFGYNLTLLVPLIAGFVLHTDAAGFGTLSACLGLGSVAAALLTAYAQRVTMQRVAVGAGAFSLILGGLALSTSFPLSALLLTALGLAGITFSTSANTLIQVIVPDHLRGRVMSLYVLLFAGSTPIGSLFIGTLSNHIGVTPTLLICAAICLLGVLAGQLYYRANGGAATPQALR